MRKVISKYGLAYFSTVVLVTVALISCDTHPGYSTTKGGIYKKLNQFGECEPALKDAEFFIMEVSYKKYNGPDTGYHFQLHHNQLKSQQKNVIPHEEGIGNILMQELETMHCGDNITYIVPFSEIDNSYLSAFAGNDMYSLEQEIELNLKLIKTFARQGYMDYLMWAAQQSELEETEAIELFLMNDGDKNFEKHGTCYIDYTVKNEGDSIKAGREISIEYTTHLLNEKSLDSTTTMRFPFGRPEQIIGGLQYGLSWLKEGEQARIYLPSALAFGEKGSSTGIVPRNTPIYFDVKVTDVKTELEYRPKAQPK
jgi:FKBP-type peptidyl-prolyl cis-trans isomerase